MSTRIVRRNLGHKEAEELTREIKRTPNIVGYQPSELLALREVLIIEDKRLLGILAWIEGAYFVDLKLLLVKEACRGKGYGHRLFAAFSDLYKGTSKPIYTTTRNPITVTMLEQAGYAKIKFYKLPLVCMLHQAKMFFSFYRFCEYARKSVRFRHQPRFSYYLKRQ